MDRGSTRCFAYVLLALALELMGSPTTAPPAMAADECLVGFSGVPDTQRDGGTLQGTASAGACTFPLQVCANRTDPDCPTTALKRVKVKGKCHGASLSFTPSGDGFSCSSATSPLTVKLKKHGKKAGKCIVTATAKSAGTPRRVDRDVLTLICNPGTTQCATTACTPPAGVTCQPLVNDGQGIAGTYQMVSMQGPKMCQTNSTKNRFGPCTSDADCGSGPGLCTASPWASADGFVLPLPPGIKTVFTIEREDPAPTCNHSACIACGDPTALCPGIPGCGSTPGQPSASSGCIQNQCCGQAGFTIPTFNIPQLLGGLCSRLDQYRCGFGAVNSSKPQSGDNEVAKMADTSDPGPDCEYGTGDDPPAKSCDNNGAGGDPRGKVTRCVGNGTCDSDGIQYRFAVPSLSTTWKDAQNPCPTDAKFDSTEGLITQIVLNAEFTTAGASGGFIDLNGDGCSVAGAGFTNFDKTGPFTIGSPPAVPQPYDSSTCPADAPCSIAVTVGEALTGKGPLFDTGFVAALSNGPMTRLPKEVCPCTGVTGCPE